MAMNNLVLVSEQCLYEIIKTDNVEKQANIAIKHNELELLFKILDTQLIFIPDIIPTIIDYKNLDLLKLVMKRYNIATNLYVIESNISYSRQVKDCDEIVQYLEMFKKVFC